MPHLTLPDLPKPVDAPVTDGSPERVALIGTGVRGAWTWGAELRSQLAGTVDLVAVVDANPVRARTAAGVLGEPPVFTDVAEMLVTARPDTVIVASRDDVHVDHIVVALEAGCRVVSEKPMVTTAEACARVLEAERRTGGRIDVGFNYRHTPGFRLVKEVLAEGAIGDVVSIDFHWYLDTDHGADYFRRWHAYQARSGGLFVHKATHHFDILNWLLGRWPDQVFATGTQAIYGPAGPFRGTSCRTCEHAGTCDFRFDMTTEPWMMALYAAAEGEDGYVRDACVFREDIDAFDTMSATLRYGTVPVSYSLNTAMPYEGYALGINGTKGRLDLRQNERQPWPEPPVDAVHVTPLFGERETRYAAWGDGFHFGADVPLRDLLFRPGADDPLGQRAGSADGAASVVVGIGATRSAQEGSAVNLTPLYDTAGLSEAQQVAGGR